MDGLPVGRSFLGMAVLTVKTPVGLTSDTEKQMKEKAFGRSGRKSEGQRAVINWFRSSQETTEDEVSKKDGFSQLKKKSHDRFLSPGGDYLNFPLPSYLNAYGRQSSTGNG